MLKKAIIGGLALTLVAGVMLGSDFGSYFRTMKRRAHDAVKSEMNLDFEVDRARTMIEDLVPTIEEYQEVVVKQQFELKRMEESIAKQEALLDEGKQAIVARRLDLKTDDKQVFVFKKRSMKRREVLRDLQDCMDRYKAADEALARDKAISYAKRDQLRANQGTLESYIGQKKELELAVAQLEARIEQLHAEEAMSTLAIDDSKLSKLKQHIQDLNDQIDVRAAMVDAEGSYNGGLIPVGQEETPDRDIAEEIDDYFSTTSSKKAEQADDEVLDPAA